MLRFRFSYVVFARIFFIWFLLLGAQAATAFDSVLVSQEDIKELIRLATEEKDAQAQFELGNLYVYGIGVELDTDKASYWYRMAVNQQHREATYVLAGMIASGVGDTGNQKEGIDMLLKLAKEGDPRAQFHMYMSYKDGFLIEKDEMSALKWLRKSAFQNYEPAVVNLGLHFKRGDLVLRNYKESEYWFEMSGGERSELLIADSLKSRKEYSGAFNRYLNYVRNKTSFVWVELGEMYEIGLGVDKNLYEAERWYRLAAEAGNVASCKKIGYFYGNGIVVKQNKNLSFKWYYKAADLSDSESQYIVGKMYEDGVGVPVDLKKADKWYRLSASGNYLPAKQALNIFQ